MRKISFIATVVSLAFSGVFTAVLAGMAYAEDVQVGESASVEGSVHFEKRHTIIPLGYCQSSSSCPQSKPYWAMVISTGDTKYEVDQLFNVGDDNEPKFVQVDGKSIPGGATLKLDATVEYASSDYYIVGRIHDVRVVMEYVDEAAVQSYPNWSCRGNLDRETEIQVAVWHLGTGGRGRGQGQGQSNRYAMRLIGTEELPGGPRRYSLATLNDVQALTQRDDVVYQGQDLLASVQLVVSGAANRPDRDNVMSTLKFTLAQLPTESAKIPAETQLEVTCSRIR